MIGARNIPARHGGLEVAAEQLSVELVSRGHEVRALVDGANQGHDHLGIRIQGVRCVRTKHLHTISQTFFSMPAVLEYRPDIAHFHGVGPGIIASVPRWRNIKTVVTVQGLDWERDKWQALAKRIFGTGVRASLGRSHAVIAVSRSIQYQLQDRLGISAHYVPNGVRLPEPVTTHDFLDELGIKPDGYVLFAARLVPEKGLHFLFDAYRCIASPPPLVVAGSGTGSYAQDYERELRKQAPPGTIFTGFLFGKALSELFAHASAYVLPSVMEGLPLSLLEAMSYARPVIHSAIPECNEVTRGDAGRSFIARDPLDLARVLGEVLDDKSAAAALGDVARQRVATEYAWDNIASKTERIYRSVSAQGQSSS
jgi:glycosyltransferase involved in cell wall biosynthesis